MSIPLPFTIYIYISYIYNYNGFFVCNIWSWLCLGDCLSFNHGNYLKTRMIKFQSCKVVNKRQNITFGFAPSGNFNENLIRKFNCYEEYK